VLFRIRFSNYSVVEMLRTPHENTFFFCHLIPVPLHNFDRAAGYRGRFE
jgi:hypothetical protein